MKRVLISCVAATILLGLSPELRAQDDLPPQLAAARSAVATEIQQKMPGWLRQSVAPIKGSRNTAIHQWEMGSYVVKVTIEMRPSRGEAAESFEKGKEHLKVQEEAAKARGRADFRLIKERLADVGQDGYTWEDANESAVAVFREDNLLVYVGVVRPAHSNEKNLSKEFARHVAKALRSK